MDGSLGNWRERVISMHTMVGTRFYFWYYAFPKPLAEEGERSV
jgi:hypothetical protein